MDWYSGSTSGLDALVDYRYGSTYIVDSKNYRNTYPVPGMLGTAFNTFDITVWAWKYIYYNTGYWPYVETNFGMYVGGGQFNQSCIGASYVTFVP